MMAVERASGAGNTTSPVATATSVKYSLSSVVPRQVQSDLTSSDSTSSSNVTSETSSTSSSPHSTPRLALNRSFSSLTTLSSSIPNLNSLTNLSSSGSFILKERLSQLKQTAQSKHEAVGKAMKSHIDFVPSSVPPRRRLQTAVVALWACFLPGSPILAMFLLSFPFLWPIMITYILYVSLDTVQEHGGRWSLWFRSGSFWMLFAEYYPARMKKEQDLPADRPYIFGYHPHGVISIGAIATFASEGTGFSKAYPGIKPHLLTLASNFKLPFYRDILCFAGVCSVSKSSCSNILKKGKGSAIAIVIGGAAESLAAHPGTADLTLRKRLGFIKLAIQHGADLVPVFSFGENDLYEQMPNQRGTMTYALQKRFQAIFGFTLPLFHGRGLLNYNLGLMPYRKPIVSVIGRPVNVVQCDKPDLDQIHEVQKRYIEELLRIWDTYKDTYATNRKRELNIID